MNNVYMFINAVRLDNFFLNISIYPILNNLLSLLLPDNWGKREPGWNNLKGLWGKRATWNKLQNGWGKRNALKAK